MGAQDTEIFLVYLDVRSPAGCRSPAHAHDDSPIWENQVRPRFPLTILAAFRKWLGGNRAKGLLPEPLAIIG